MRNSKVVVAALLVFGLAVVPASAEPVVKVTVHNPSADHWAEAPITFACTDAMRPLPKGPLALKGPEKVFVQADDLDGDGKPDELAALVSLEPGQSKSYELVADPTVMVPEKRTHTGMYLRGLVGPGWESELTAYRIYWNSATAIDIFGKTQPILSLEAYAAPGLNYHVESKYGMDVLKVGPALGVGGFGVWLDGKVYKIADTLRTYHVRATGPIRAVLDCEFVDWYVGPGEKKPGASGPGVKRRLDLTARLSIFAGQKWGTAELFCKPVDRGPVPEFVTGVVKHEQTELIQDEERGMVGRWGLQALGDHEVRQAANLGLGVVVDPATVAAYGEDAVNSYVRLKATDGRVTYRYHGSWAKEPGAADSTAAYQAMLAKVAGLRPQVKVAVLK